MNNVGTDMKQIAIDAPEAITCLINKITDVNKSALWETLDQAGRDNLFKHRPLILIMLQLLLNTDTASYATQIVYGVRYLQVIVSIARTIQHYWTQVPNVTLGLT